MAYWQKGEKTRPMTRSSMRFMLLVMVLLTSWLGVAPAHAAVELSYFEIEQGPTPPALLIKWGTETERDTVEFIVKRGDNANPAQAVQIHSTPARGSSVSGFDYQHLDDDTRLISGRVYYYWLIERTGSGQEKEVGSTQATAGGGTATPIPTAPSATATPTTQLSTATPTTQLSTATPTTQLSTATPTAQPPAATPIPTTLPATATPTAQSTVAPQGTTSAPQPAATATPQAPASIPTTGTLANTPTGQPPAAATDPPAAPTTGATNPAPGDAASQPTAPPSGDAQPVQTTNAPAIDASTPQAGERSQNQDAAVQEPATSAPATDQSSTTTTDQAGADPTGEATATPQMLAEAPAAPQAQLVRPTATPRPSDSSGGGDNTSSLLTVIGAGSLCGAVLLILVVVFVWRRR